LDSHRWVPLPAVGFSGSSVGDENHEDVTPPSNLMEHPPLAVFINGESSKCFVLNIFITCPLSFAYFTLPLAC